MEILKDEIMIVPLKGLLIGALTSLLRTILGLDFIGFVALHTGRSPMTPAASCEYDCIARRKEFY
jgi:hypothetical protein